MLDAAADLALQREFKIAVVEVWGCGGPKASADQEAQKAWEGRARERMLKVKRPGRCVRVRYQPDR
jgi:hypothetical protein